MNAFTPSVLMIDETLGNGPIRSVNPNVAPIESGCLSDDELAALAHAGDEHAFAEIFDRYRKLVVHLVGRFFNRRDEIEDISQQAFTKLFLSLGDFRGGHERSFSAWISRITVNACYDELRKRGRRQESLFSEFSDEEREQIDRLVSGHDADEENRIVSRDLASKILARLDPKERLALTLLHGEELSVAEIAGIVGWSESNVKTRLFRCRNNLRNIFGHFFRT